MLITGLNCINKLVQPIIFLVLADDLKLHCFVWYCYKDFVSDVKCIFFYFIDQEKSVFKPYNFKMEEIEGFRYRAKVDINKIFSDSFMMIHG